jgi:hypothetical protein
VQTVETDDDIVSDDNCSPDVGPPTDNPSEDIVYNDSTLISMSSCLLVGEQQQQEIEAVRNQLSENEPMPWLSVENEPLNEYQISHLATMAFPTLFPGGKGEFGCATVTYLGHEVGQGHVKPVQAKISAILEFPTPTSKKQLMRFLCMAAYYRKFCLDFSNITEPLTMLLKKNVGFALSQDCETAFQKVKAMLTSRGVHRIGLDVYNPTIA